MKTLGNILNWNLIASLGRLWEILKTTSLIVIAVAVGLALGNYINCDYQMTVWTIANSPRLLRIQTHTKIIHVLVN